MAWPTARPVPKLHTQNSGRFAPTEVTSSPPVQTIVRAGHSNRNRRSAPRIRTSPRGTLAGVTHAQEQARIAVGRPARDARVARLRVEVEAVLLEAGASADVQAVPGQRVAHLALDVEAAGGGAREVRLARHFSE